MHSLPGAVADAEGITRFLVWGNQFAASTGRVKPPALMPHANPQTGRAETSIYRTDGLPAEAIWRLGYQFVENIVAGRRIRARGFAAASIVTGQSLQFEANGVPHPRHADIIGWPNAKDARLMLATEIANVMTLETDPRP